MGNTCSTAMKAAEEIKASGLVYVGSDGRVYNCKDEIRFGDVVTLNSSQYPMTVIGTNKDSIACHWFEGSHLKMGAYPESCLTKIKEVGYAK